MKRILCLLVVAVCLFSFALADYTPSYSTDKVEREYKYDESGFSPKLIIQEGDLDESCLCATIREIIKDDIGEKETIEEVSIDSDAVLHIVVSWGPDAIPQYIENYEIARDRFCSITDSILSYVDLDAYWETIQYTYPNGEATFTKDMIIDSEYGRYFDRVDDLIK